MLHNPERLANVDPDLVRVAQDVGTMEEIVVVFGARSLSAEEDAIATGHSHLHSALDSKHVVAPPLRPYAEAMDLAEYTGDPANPVDWKNHASFVRLAGVVKTRASALGVPITWGGDWPHPFDFDHFEKAQVA